MSIIEQIQITKLINRFINLLTTKFGQEIQDYAIIAAFVEYINNLNYEEQNSILKQEIKKLTEGK